MNSSFSSFSSSSSSSLKPGILSRRRTWNENEGEPLSSDLDGWIPQPPRTTDVRFGRGLFAVVMLLLLLLPAQLRAQAPDAAFDAANKLYEAGKYSDAVAAYEKLGQNGHASVALYFNLGNAYFKSGQIGRAIAAYRCAEQMAPRDPDIRANLRFARNQVQGPTQPPSRWQQWLGRLTLNEWTTLAAAAFWLCLILLTLPQWRPSLKPAVRSYTLAAALATVLLGACAALAYSDHRPGTQAIVAVSDAKAHNAPLDESPAAFALQNGAELRVLDQKDDWLQVSPDSSRIGWLRRSQVLLGR